MMGSNPSKRIQSADVHRQKRPETPQRSFSLSNTRNGTKVKQIQPEPSTKNQAFEDVDQFSRSPSSLKKELETTKKLMTEIECQNLELQDHIQTLEQQLECLQQQQENKPSEECAETVHVKDQLIDKLQKEAEKVQTEMTDLKLKCKKKVRAVKRKSVISKNELSMEILELKEDMRKLEEQNKKLKENQGKRQKQVDEVEENEKSEDENSGREAGKMKIILDLSAQVSEQDSQLTELRNKLNERDKYISNLEKDLKLAKASMSEERPVKTSTEKPAMSTEVEKKGATMRSGYDFIKDREKYSAESQDISWYTNQTFEQLAKGKAESGEMSHNNKRETKGAISQGFDQEDHEEIKGLRDSKDDESELSAIAKEIKELQQARKKKTKTGMKGKKNMADVNMSDKKDVLKGREKSVFLTEGSDLSDGSDGHNIHGSVELSRKEATSSSNVRMISGLGKKTKRKSRGENRQSMTESLKGSGATVFSVSGKDSDLSEASLLLDSIDEDMRQLMNGSRQQLPCIST